MATTHTRDFRHRRLDGRQPGRAEAAPAQDAIRGQHGFVSILDPAAPDEPRVQIAEPDYFVDLHIADIVRDITRGRDAYELGEFFRSLCRDVATVHYRHEVFHDLENGQILSAISAFGEGMRRMSVRLVAADAAHYRFEKERWFVDAVQAYCDAVARLAEELQAVPVRSAGLLSLRAYLLEYVGGSRFADLVRSVRRVRDALTALVFGLRIGAGQLTVTRYEGEPDYGSEVLATFEKFRQGSDKTYEFKFSWSREINHIESAVVDRVAQLHPEPFAALDRFYAVQQGFADKRITRFAREVQFYLAYREYADGLKERGLEFSYPTIDVDSGACRARALFDMALAESLAPEGRTPVTNDFELTDGQRVLVVSGPNQGGKTTYARSIGQLHHFAALGVPVPAAAARVPLVDGIFTHFERPEQVEDLAGKLEDDLRRMKRILHAATERSLIVMNESFSSTTTEDQLVISTAVLRQMIERGVLCVLVTFLDELASFSPTVVSMVASVDIDDPARRTYRIERRPADGKAYALALATKRGLTYSQLKKRLTK